MAYSSPHEGQNGSPLLVEPNKLHVSDACSEAWEALRASPGTRRMTFAPHDVIYFEGDEAEHLYELKAGQVMLYKLLPDGRRQVVEVLGPGDLFGFNSDAHHTCSAETLIDTKLLAFNRREVELTAAVQPYLARRAIQQVYTMHDHALLLGRKSAYERVATFLMRFVSAPEATHCTCSQNEPNAKGLVQINMSRQEMADYLGLTVETLCRVISDMKRQGLIRLEKHDLVIVNRICGLHQLTGASAD